VDLDETLADQAGHVGFAGLSVDFFEKDAGQVARDLVADVVALGPVSVEHPEAPPVLEFRDHEVVLIRALRFESLAAALLLP